MDLGARGYKIDNSDAWPGDHDPDDEVEQRYSINTGTWKPGFLLESLAFRFSVAILFISDVI